ncbi:Serine/threonine-protein kinase PknB [Thalassocella blandensis]|nr:Serine/threonine-protein kinase PknB [Thalassocella blandensis]
MPDNLVNSTPENPSVKTQTHSTDASNSTENMSGSTIGHYTLVKLIGKGSMSDVYLARRADGIHDELLALKTSRAWGNPQELHARMQRERKILSQFKHPNIAAFLDGGNADNNRPYFVLEYVDGQPITQWCKQRKLPLNARLALFTQVCSAVFAAHSKLILHRDIKPSNILIDQNGIPKLLDFGIAKILDEDKEQMALTQFESPMTPQYASPEQARHETLSVASDQYSLGILLYELITDELPYQVGNGNVLQTICDTPIPLPSACLAAQEKRGILPDPQNLKRTRGDLDAIVMKAIDKNPDARYSSVEELSTDIQRFLENKTVFAQKASSLYTAQQFIKRHRSKVILGTGLLTLLVAIAATQQIRIVNERNQAIAERDKFEQTQEFLLNLFEHANPEGLPQENITARELLNRGTEMIRHKFTDQPEVKSAMLLAIGKAYFKLRLSDLAFDILSESLAIQNTLGAPANETRAVTLSHLAKLSINKGEPEQAERYIDESLSIFSALESKNTREWIFAYFMAGEVAYGLRNIDISTQYYQNALSLTQSNFGPDDAFITGIYANLSENYGYIFDFDQALKYNTLALQQAENTPLESEIHLPKIYNVQGVINWWQDDLGAALDSFNKAIDINIELYGEHTPSVVEDYMNIATIYSKLHEYANALIYFQKALDVLEHNDDQPILAKTYTSMGRPLLQLDKDEEALQKTLKGLEIKTKIYSDKFSEPFALSYHMLGAIYEKAGNSDLAIDYYTRANDIRVKLYGADNKWTKENAAGLLRLQSKD